MSSFFEPELSLLDADGQKRAVVNLVAGHPQLMLLDEMGNILSTSLHGPSDVSLSMTIARASGGCLRLFGINDDPEISMADSVGNMSCLSLIDGGPGLFPMRLAANGLCSGLSLSRIQVHR